MPPTPLSVHLILLVVQVCFAANAVAGRMALAHVPANAIVLVRVAGGAVVFLALAAAGGLVPVERRWVPRLFLCTVLGVIANQTLFLNGLAFTTATNAAVIGTSIPVFTTLLAALVGAEPPRALRFVGVAIGLAGALVLVRVDRFAWSDRHAVGNLMLLANSLSYGSFLVVVRPLAMRIPPLQLVALLFTLGVPFAGLIGARSWTHAAPQLTRSDVGLLAFIVAVPTVAAYALNQVALRRAQSSLVAIYIYLQPVLVAVAAALLLGERPDLRTGVAAALIFLGVWVAGRSGGRADGRRST